MMDDTIDYVALVEQYERDEAIARQLQRQQEEDNANRISSQSFTFSLTPQGTSVRRGTSGNDGRSVTLGDDSAGIPITGNSYNFNLNSGDTDDDGWITIASTVADMGQISLGGGQGGFNLADMMQQGADPHPDDLPVPGDDPAPTMGQTTGQTTGRTPEQATSQSTRQTASEPATQSQSNRVVFNMNSQSSPTFNINDFFNQGGADPHPDDLPVEDENVGDPDSVEAARDNVIRFGTGGATVTTGSRTNGNQESFETDNGTSNQRTFHFRLNQDGGWSSVNDGDENNNEPRVLNSNSGVQIRSVQITSSSSGTTSRPTLGGTTSFVINTDDIEGGGNYENLFNLVDHQVGLSQQQIESLPTRTLTERITEYNCSICMEPMEAGDRVRTLPCFHQLHVECVDPWLSRKKVCPVCRADVKFEYDG